MADHVDKKNSAKPTTAAGKPTLRVAMTGAITETYQGDPEQLIKRLNELRGTEIVAWLQYKHHSYMAVSMAMPGVRAEFEEHAAQEEHHADMLGERISQLGGIPVFEPFEIGQLAAKDNVTAKEGATMEDMVRVDLAMERQQIRLYQTLIREVAFQDPTTRRILEDILIETEHHATEMQNLLDRTAPLEHPGKT
ncbi:MAG: ferritin-like domain-containing protein [Candidatus Sericytochromatia bacterium]|nr:ferritin-like domain-containing protein [Candidatus Sericytochromatia bacterium]